MTKEKLDHARSGAEEQSAVDRIISAIRLGVTEGLLVPGQRLVEADLTRRFGVSRGPVREALRRLVAEGLLTHERNKGISVRQLTRKEISDLYKIRERLQALAARLAAENIGKEGRKAVLREMRAEAMKASKASDWHRYFDLNDRCHAVIVEMSDNPQLIQLIEQFNIHFFRLPFRRALAADIPNMHVGLDAAIAAIVRGDADAAEFAMTAHVHAIANATNLVPDSFFKTP